MKYLLYIFFDNEQILLDKFMTHSAFVTSSNTRGNFLLNKIMTNVFSKGVWPDIG